MAWMMPDEDDGREFGPQVVGAASQARTPGLRMRGSPPDIAMDDGFSVRQEFPTEAERKWCCILAVGSGVDVLVSGIIMVVAFRFAALSNGATLYSVGLQSTSHLLSSILLAVRFAGESKLHEYSGHQAESLLRAQRLRFLHREQGLSIAMGLVMMVSSAGLLFKAALKLKHWDEWYVDHEHMDAQAAWAGEFLAWYGFAVYLVQVVFRCVANKRLRRSIIGSAIVCSVVSMLFLFVLGFSASYQKEWSWKAEPMAALVLCLANLIESIRIVVMNLDDMEMRLRYDSRA